MISRTTNADIDGVTAACGETNLGLDAKARSTAG
jgi:hypothetical protein